ncbi:2-dehydro-3-deoxygluconokinase [Synergistales bacterium]|nr:2-dehydro-3-deoxygluconokinase [Synergistales bacterium]
MHNVMGKIIGFGEIMLRLAPKGHLKFVQANEFELNYTGAEANVCVSLSNFGLQSDFVTKLPANDIAACAVKKLHQFGVGTDKIVWGGDRMGSYFLERGASQRPSKVIYDRKYAAISMVNRDEFNWDKIFEDACWFHFTGITPALGPNLPQICEDACIAAKARSIPVSCDLNYRKNLWDTKTAYAVMTKLVKYCDVLIGNEEDAETTLGLKPEGTNVVAGALNYDAYGSLAKKISEEYSISHVAFTLRTSISASVNGWAAMLYHDGTAYFSKDYTIQLVDRVGGGDSFGAGLIYALIKKYSSQDAIEFATAASCLKQTMEMDFNLATVEEVRRLMEGDGSGRVQR